MLASAAQCHGDVIAHLAQKQACRLICLDSGCGKAPQFASCADGIAHGTGKTVGKQLACEMGLGLGFRVGCAHN